MTIEFQSVGGRDMRAPPHAGPEGARHEAQQVQQARLLLRDFMQPDTRAAALPGRRNRKPTAGRGLYRGRGGRGGCLARPPLLNIPRLRRGGIFLTKRVSALLSLRATLECAFARTPRGRNTSVAPWCGIECCGRVGVCAWRGGGGRRLPLPSVRPEHLPFGIPGQSPRVVVSLAGPLGRLWLPGGRSPGISA